MCPHTTICVLILLYVSSYDYTCAHTPELPAAFNEKIDTYAKEEALVFDGLDFMAVSGSSLL
jgi:hypothetical protein